MNDSEHQSHHAPNAQPPAAHGAAGGGHGAHGMHEGHGGHGAMSAMTHGAAGEYLRKFWIVTFLLIPLIFTNEAISGFLGVPMFPFAKWVGFGIATIIFSFALVFFQHAWHEIKARKYGMMTLVSLAVGSGYLFSAVSTFLPQLEAEFYLEISTLVWVLLFGHYLEARSSSAAGNALEEVAKLLPQKAHRLVSGNDGRPTSVISGEWEDVEVGELKEGDAVQVLPGEKIPADGTIEGGGASVDESLISGESKPVSKKKGDGVVAGSICLDGSLTIRLSRVGEHSTVGQIQKLISEAQKTKPRSQRLADKASAVLTFVAGITALLVILVWTLLLGEPFVFAITLAITVLVIACPHALGLAIPTVTTITTRLAVKNGVFIKNLAKIETLNKADYVLFDKTGTLTAGHFGVKDVVPVANLSASEVLAIAAAIETHSSHIIGQSIVRYASAQTADVQRPQFGASEVKNVAGKGMTAMVSGARYAVGNRAMMQELKVESKAAEQQAKALAERGDTLVYVADDSRVVGLIALADAVKKESYEAVKKLHALNVKVAMLTGDTKQVAEGVAKDLGIDTYFAEVLPEDKYEHIKALQAKGSVVVMVGDGVNDAPSLAQADVGVAIGAGTDVAVEAGDVVLLRSNPLDIARLLTLSRAVYRKMVQNLVWALGYNVVAIPAAAGAFAHPIFFGGIFLRPEIGALLMSLSTVIVVVNALTLKTIRI